MRGRRQAIRTGADDRDVAAIIGTINDNIHAILPQFLGFHSTVNVAGAGFDFINASAPNGQNRAISLWMLRFWGDIGLNRKPSVAGDWSGQEPPGHRVSSKAQPRRRQFRADIDKARREYRSSAGAETPRGNVEKWTS
jgi:hypothetical protein